MAQPLTHARIGYDSITRRGTVVASGETSGFPATAAQNELTYSSWKVGVPATWEVQLDAPETCNYFGIAAHNLGQSAIYAAMQAFIDNEWQTLRVLNPGVLGDVFTFDAGLTGERGTPVYGATSGSRRVGVAADGREVVGIAVLPDTGSPAVNANVAQSKFGTHALTIEPATENLLSQNVRTGTDSEEDTTGFTPNDGSAVLTSDTEHYVSGSRSLKMVASGTTGFDVTAAVDASGTYTFSGKVLADEQGGSLTAYVYDGTTLFISSAVDYYTDNLGKWVFFSYTVTVGGAASSANFGLSVNASTTVWVDELQVEAGGVAHTWVDGTSTAGDLAYLPELVQQFEDCTVNMWVRAPSDLALDGDRVLFSARSLSGDDVFELRMPGGNLLTNPGFEQGDTGWTISGSGGALEDPGARTGSWLYALLENAEAHHTALFDASPGAKYLARIRIHTLAAGKDGRLRVEFLDSAQSLLSSVQDIVVSESAYALAELEGTCPASTAYIRFVLDQDGNGGFPAGTVVFDDSELYIARPIDFNTSGASGSDSIRASDQWDGDWHMVTAVLDASNGVKRLYWDGVEVGESETEHLPTWQQIANLEIGHEAGADLTGPDLLIDDLSIVNYAATAAQVAAWFARTESIDLEGAELPPQSDNRPIMRLVEDTKASRFRISLAGTGTAQIGVIYMGKALEMPRPLYGGHTPINLARKTVLRRNVTERGQWAGSTIIRSGARGSWTWNHIEAEWVRRYLDPFLEAVRTHPFFILWRPETFPNEAAYCWTLDDLAPSNMGLRDWMTFTLDAEGLGHE